MPLKKSSSFVSLFDIRLKSVERDVVVIRGNTDEASSVLLSGAVVIAAMDPLTIKRVRLKCEGTLKMKWSEHIQTPRGPSARPVKLEKVIFQHEWQNLENTSSLATGRTFGSSGLTSMNSSTTNLAGLASLASAVEGSSGTQTPGLLHRSSSSHALAQGNHELPFSIVIPGDVPESVEGLDGAQVVYRLTAVVERGRFSNNITARKHFRIVRTLGSDAFDMQSTISIENTWPNKVDYTIETPSKAIAIGSTVRVDMVLVPLLKGLKLGNVKTQLVQQTTFACGGHTMSKEVVCHEQVTLAPEDGLLGRDKWDVHEPVQIPASLAKVTQDVEIGNYVKVSHKLKFAIGLVNPDGHVSELRASLPIYLFISPSVTVSSRIDPDALGNDAEENIFEGTQRTGGGDDENSSTAPPNYESHVLDQLWQDVDITGINSPNHSGESTPYRSRRSSMDADSPPLGLTSLDPTQRSQLAAGLRALERAQAQQQQQQQQPTVSRPNEPTASHHSSQSGSAVHTPYAAAPAGPANQSIDYFSQVRTGGGSGGVQQHHSNPNSSHGSAAQSPVLSPYSSDIDVNFLSRVPSYETAIKSTDNGLSDAEVAPDYNSSGPSSPPSSNPSFVAPRSALTGAGAARGHHTRNSLSSSAPGSTFNLAGLGPLTPSSLSQHGSHADSSPNLRAHSRNISSTALNSLIHRNHSSRSLFHLKKNHD